MPGKLLEACNDHDLREIVPEGVQPFDGRSKGGKNGQIDDQDRVMRTLMAKHRPNVRRALPNRAFCGRIRERPGMAANDGPVRREDDGATFGDIWPEKMLDAVWCQA